MFSLVQCLTRILWLQLQGSNTAYRNCSSFLLSFVAVLSRGAYLVCLAVHGMQPRATYLIK